MMAVLLPVGRNSKRGEREWWEGDRRERDNREKRGGRERWEDDMRERDEARRGDLVFGFWFVMPPHS